MELKTCIGCNHEFTDRELICSNCGEPNPVFRKLIATSKKKYSAPKSQKKRDLLSVIFTLLIVFGGFGGAKTVINGVPYNSLLPLSLAVVGIAGLIVMFI